MVSFQVSVLKPGIKSLAESRIFSTKPLQALGFPLSFRAFPKGYRSQIISVNISLLNADGKANRIQAATGNGH